MKILLTAFRGSSAEALIKDWEAYPKIIFPNHKVRDSELLKDVISKQNYDYIISFGQKPNIKDKVYIETTGKQGNICMETSFPWDMLRRLLQEKGLCVKVSQNAGTSFCNQLYFNGLRYLQESNADTKMIFIHIPFEKNISDLKWSQTQLYHVLEQLK